jgi:5'-3' exonuclease
LARLKLPCGHQSKKGFQSLHKTGGGNMTHILVDTANTFFRARHVIRGDSSEKIGMAIHITMNSIKKAWQDFEGSHVVFCLEGRSWRKDHYAPYKRNRKEVIESMTAKEKEENEVFWECYDDFCKFIKEKTNVTVLQNPRAEADDLIARWIDKHPNDKHVIISTDKDLNQLVNMNVKQYNGVTEQTITHEGWFDKKGDPVIDKRTKMAKGAPDTEWIIFEKSMRGDPSDNIFSAYPGVRTKGTKNKIGLQEAFADRKEKGYTWNNLMLSKWVDPEGKEHRVLEDYERNKSLVDLHAQPEAIIEELDQTIAQAKSENKNISQVGIRFMKFCAKYDLNRISEQAQLYVEPFNARLVS